MQLFEKFGQNSKGVVFKRGMENMLGKRDWGGLVCETGQGKLKL
jgi:hypothetical protein